MKKLIILSLAVILSFAPRMLFADMSQTADYLRNQNPNDWAAQALVAIGDDDVDISFVDSDADTLMSAAKHLMTLAATESTDEVTIQTLLGTIKASYVNGQLGSENLLNDDFWGLMALSSVGDTTYQNELKSFILANQNDDGGWSWSTGQDSDTNDTAAAIMALLDTDLNAQSAEIIDALDYLQLTQNEDGGFPYNLDSESDGASTAWVIAALNKAGIEPSAWQKNGNPISFLNSLETGDGSYLWLPGDESGSSVVTAYAAVALTDNFYPVNYISIEEENPSTGIDVRIEGPDSTLCLASNVLVGNILEVLTEAANTCNIDITVTDTDYGPYVSSIGGIDAEGMDGWQYWVNWEAGMSAVDEYNLSGGDGLLWAYGGFPFYASKLEINQNRVESDEQFTATVTYYDGDEWLAVYNQDLKVGDSIYQTDVNGQVTASIAEDGVYPVYLTQSDTYARSNKKYITVGSGISQNVDLTVNINNTGGGGDDEDVIAFSVSQSSIDFGSLQPGQSAETSINLRNTGNVAIYIEADILGSQIWQDYTTLNQEDWLDFGESISEDQSLAITLRLSLPQSIASGGQANGQLIFWAVGR